MTDTLPASGEIQVEAIDWMPKFYLDGRVADAARTSYLQKSKGEEKDKALIGYMMKHRHTTPFEHVIFTFWINAPVVAWWQIVRHRTLSINLQSGRYTEYDEGMYYAPKPDKWRLQAKNGNKQMSDGYLTGYVAKVLTNSAIKHYEDGYNLYLRAIEHGVAREQARMYFLPGFAMMHQGYVTVDAHNLMHLLTLRTAPEAQEETRIVANKMEEIFKELMPWTYEFYKEKRSE